MYRFECIIKSKEDINNFIKCACKCKNGIEVKVDDRVLNGESLIALYGLELNERVLVEVSTYEDLQEIIKYTI